VIELVLEENSADRVRIYPVTRIGGRADIEVIFTPSHEVNEARFRALKNRNFEGIVQGIHYSRVPLILSRICASCGVFHQVASCLAIEEALGVEIPPAASLLRELLLFLSLASRHLYRMIYFDLPDYALPMSDPHVRNVFGIEKIEQEVLSKLISVKRAFSTSLEILCGFSIHSGFSFPGGVSSSLSEEDASRIEELLGGCEETLKEVLDLSEMLIKRDSKIIDSGRPLRGFYMSACRSERPSLVGESVTINSFTSEENLILEKRKFISALEREQLTWTFIEPVTVAGIQPVLTGALARANFGFGALLPWTEIESKRFFEQWGKPLGREFHSFIATNLEIIWAWERARQILREASIIKGETYVPVESGKGEGAAILETPSGIAIHEVVLDEKGNVKSYMITGPLQINHAMLNESLTFVAKDIVSGLEIDDQAAQRLKFCARAFNPCVNCGTH